MKKICIYIFLLIFLTSTASSSYAAEPKPDSDWKIFSTGEYGYNTTYGKVVVYKDKSTKSGQVKTLPDGTGVEISEFHGRRIINPDGSYDTEGWAKLTKPVVGWADYRDFPYEGSIYFDFGLFHNNKPLDDFTEKILDMMRKFNESTGLTAEERIPDEAYEGSAIYYYQGNDSVSVVQHIVGSEDDYDSVIIFGTRDQNFVFPGGFRIGDPVSQVIKSGLIPGTYKENVLNGVKHHIWVGNWEFSIAENKDGTIANAMLIDGKLVNSTKINSKYMAFKGPAPKQAAKPAQSAPAKPTPKKNTVESLFGSGQSIMNQPAAAQTNDDANTANLSTDIKVINFYPLPPGDKNALSIQHRAAYNMYSKKSYKNAYDAFSKLADQYSCNYLSAYWAGESAMKLGRKNDAKTWYDKALSVNPDYKPAKDARAKVK